MGKRNYSFNNTRSGRAVMAADQNLPAPESEIPENLVIGIITTEWIDVPPPEENNVQ